MTLSVSAAQPNDSLDARYYRLFAPVTFYHDVADKALALNSESSGKDVVADEVDAMRSHKTAGNGYRLDRLIKGAGTNGLHFCTGMLPEHTSQCTSY